MKRYYECERFIIKNNPLIYAVVKKRKEDKEDEKYIGFYKQVCCFVRKEKGINNIMTFALPSDKNITDEVMCIVFDYKLPDQDWNAWCEVKYDEELDKFYVEINE